MKRICSCFFVFFMLMSFGKLSARTEYIGPNAVDLGLSVLWGDKNMQDISLKTLYFYWAETSKGGNGMTQVDTDDEYPDNICGTKYDVATEYYGDGWRLPTAEEFKELYNNCTSRFSSAGVTFTAPNGNSITLESVGYINKGTSANDYSYYWTGTKGNPGIWNQYISRIATDSNEPIVTFQRYAPDAFGFNSSGLKDNNNICNYLYSNEYRCAIRPVKDLDYNKPYGILDNGTLTFYYDKKKSTRTGIAYGIEASYSSSNLPAWAKDSLSIKNVIFDVSFANYSPTSTSYWFGGHYNNLTSISNLTYLNTANVTNMRGMFYFCKSLKELDLSSFNTANVTDMTFMFAGCESLRSLDVSFFNTSKVTSMGSMFTNCSQLTTLELRNFDTSNVTDMGWMFYGCKALTQIGISTFNTSKVTQMRCMFYDCSNLEEIDVSGFNTSNVTDMGWMFIRCSKIKSLYVTGFYTSKVSDMYAMFWGCTSLTTIYAKSGTWDTSKVTNSGIMFGNCPSLVGGMGTQFNADHIEKEYAHIDGGTSNPGYFTNLAPTLPGGTIAYAVYDNSILTFYYDNKSGSRTGTKYTIESSYSYSRQPGWVRDYYRRVFTKAVFDSSFASYRPTSTAFWFYNCSAMTTIADIGNLNTSKVTSMAEMFRYCDVLNNLDLSSFDTSNVTDMSYMFCYCHSLTNVNLSGFNTSNVEDMQHLFHQCPMPSVDVSSFNTSKVKNMYLMFAECRNLKNLDLKNFDTGNVSLFAGMFYRDNKLTTVNASDKWSIKKGAYGYWMFYGDTKLVGSMGTRYDGVHFDLDYAHIDGGRCNPGYLSGDITLDDLGPKEAYAVLDDGVLTFYYDSFKDCTDGKIYPIESDYSYTHLPAWHEDRSQIMVGVFDSSFADYRPANTSYWFYELDQMAALNDVVYLNTSEVLWMSAMFWECHNLRTLDVSNFNTVKVKKMYGMFCNCRQLAFLDVRNFNTANVEDMSNMFWGCNSLTKLDVSKFVTANVKNMYGMFYDCKNLKAIDVSKFNTANVENMAAMFMRCEVLENLNLKNFNTAKVVDMEMMFYMCYKLQSLDVSSFNTSNVTNMRSMFDWLKSVKKLDLSNFNTAKVMNMQSMFSGCDILEEVNLSSFDTRNVRDMTGMFHALGKMKAVNISNFNTANVESMEQMFCDSPELTTIYVGDAWSTASVTNSQDMFTASRSIVGGAGTKYDFNHVDHEYARIDGGASRPGYFTKGASFDVNDDGTVDVADIASIIDVMAGHGDAATKNRADVNCDGSVDVADIASVIDKMAASSRQSGEDE